MHNTSVSPCFSSIIRLILLTILPVAIIKLVIIDMISAHGDILFL